MKSFNRACSVIFAFFYFVCCIRAIPERQDSLSDVWNELGSLETLKKQNEMAIPLLSYLSEFSSMLESDITMQTCNSEEVNSNSISIENSEIKIQSQISQAEMEKKFRELGSGDMKWSDLRLHPISQYRKQWRSFCMILWTELKAITSYSRLKCDVTDFLMPASKLIVFLYAPLSKSIHADFLRCSCYSCSNKNVINSPRENFFVHKYKDKVYFILKKLRGEVLQISDIRVIARPRPTLNSKNRRSNIQFNF